MDLPELKLSIQNLLGKVNDDILLSEFYAELHSYVEPDQHQYWNNLSEADKEDILNSLQDSHSSDNLIPNSDAFAKFKKWL